MATRDVDPDKIKKRIIRSMSDSITTRQNIAGVNVISKRVEVATFEEIADIKSFLKNTVSNWLFVRAVKGMTVGTGRAIITFLRALRSTGEKAWENKFKIFGGVVAYSLIDRIISPLFSITDTMLGIIRFFMEMAFSLVAAILVYGTNSILYTMGAVVNQLGKLAYFAWDSFTLMLSADYRNMNDYLDKTMTLVDPTKIEKMYSFIPQDRILEAVAAHNNKIIEIAKDNWPGYYDFIKAGAAALYDKATTTLSDYMIVPLPGNLFKIQSAKGLFEDIQISAEEFWKIVQDGYNYGSDIMQPIIDASGGSIVIALVFLGGMTTFYLIQAAVKKLSLSAADKKLAENALDYAGASFKKGTSESDLAVNAPVFHRLIASLVAIGNGKLFANIGASIVDRLRTVNTLNNRQAVAIVTSFDNNPRKSQRDESRPPRDNRPPRDGYRPRPYGDRPERPFTPRPDRPYAARPQGDRPPYRSGPRRDGPRPNYSRPSRRPS